MQRSWYQRWPRIQSGQLGGTQLTGRRFYRGDPRHLAEIVGDRGDGLPSGGGCGRRGQSQHHQQRSYRPLPQHLLFDHTGLGQGTRHREQGGWIGLRPHVQAWSENSQPNQDGQAKGHSQRPPSGGKIGDRRPKPSTPANARQPPPVDPAPDYRQDGGKQAVRRQQHGQHGHRPAHCQPLPVGVAAQKQGGHSQSHRQPGIGHGATAGLHRLGHRIGHGGARPLQGATKSGRDEQGIVDAHAEGKETHDVGQIDRQRDVRLQQIHCRQPNQATSQGDDQGQKGGCHRAIDQ